MFFPKIAEGILNTLIEAEEGGKPLTLDEALVKWGSGSTWEDLTDNRYILRLQTAVTVTKAGRDWLESRK